jgi:hypothetical protein
LDRDDLSRLEADGGLEANDPGIRMEHGAAGRNPAGIMMALPGGKDLINERKN